MNFPRASGFELELIPLTVLFLSIAILHEMIHLLALKLLRVKIYKVKLVKFMAVPLALMVLYDEMTITQYLVGVLSPQILTILFIALALAVKINASLYFYKGPLHILFLPSVCTTFNSILGGTSTA